MSAEKLFSIQSYLATGSGRKSAFAVAAELQDARNQSNALEEKLCAAFRSLGFEVTPLGGPNNPDGVAAALLAADEKGVPRQYQVSLEAKSKQNDKGTVAAGTVNVSAVARHRKDYKCDHAIVVGRDFPTSRGDLSTLVREIDDDRAKTEALGQRKTITLITIDDLAKLVRLRPINKFA